MNMNPALQVARHAEKILDVVLLTEYVVIKVNKNLKIFRLNLTNFEITESCHSDKLCISEDKLTRGSNNIIPLEFYGLMNNYNQNQLEYPSD